MGNERAIFISAPTASDDEAEDAMVNAATRETLVLTDLPQLIHEDTGRSAPEPGGSHRGRVDNWKRELLDLSKSNRLLNFKDTKKTVRLLCHSLSDLEDHLADGKEFSLLPQIVDNQSSPPP